MNRYILKTKVSRLASFAALFVVIGLMVFVPQGSIFAATIPINNLTGVVAAGDGLCTLPEAINNANAGGDTTGGDCPAGVAGSDTIVLSGSVTLTTTNVIDAVIGRDGLPTVTSTIIVEGNGFTITRSTAGCSAVPGNAATDFRIFRVAAGGNLTLNNMTISNGCANDPGVQGQQGGAIYNDGGTLRVTNSTLTGNYCYDSGGAIYSEDNGNLTIVSSVFTNNTAQAGGALHNALGGQANIYNSTFSNNTVVTAARGGAIFNTGDGLLSVLTLVNSAVTNNVADGGTGAGVGATGAGGGIYTHWGARADIIDTVISNNYAARDGGGIWVENAGTVTNLIRSTVSGNTSTYRSGGIIVLDTGAAVQTIENSTISGNTGAYIGALFNSNSTVNVTHSTLSNNTSLLDPTITGILTANGAPVTTINGGIVANNINRDCNAGAGGSFAGANNFDSSTSCPGPAAAITPGTHYSTALASNGGPTQTHQLIGPVGRDAAAGCGLATDQRGVPRDANCDAGSYEISTITPVQVSFWPDNATIPEVGAGVATITVQYNNPNAVNLDVTAYFTITGSASGSGIDYTLAGLGAQQQITYTVPPGVSTRTFTVTAVDDTPLVDPGETVVMNLSKISGYAQVVGVNPQTVTITEATVAVPTEAAAPAGVGAAPAITVFDPAISKLGFFTRGQVGIVGEQIEWVVTVTNVGTGAGTNVVVADTVPSSMRVDKVVTSLGTAVVSGQTVTVTIPTLASGQSIQFSIFTTVLKGGEMSNTACVTAVNLVGERCATALPVQTLPITGQTPWWRMWVIVFSGLAVVGGLSLCVRRVVLVRRNHA